MGIHTCRSDMRTVVPAGIVLFLLTPAGAPLMSSLVVPASIDEHTLLSQVSEERIMHTIRELEMMGSRSYHLETSREAAARIQTMFSAVGLSVAQQEFMVGNVLSSNVIATMAGSDPGAPCILFGAHYDSENKAATNLSLIAELPAPGADDDASGVAVVIELATVLSGVRLRNTVKFVAFGAEEKGLEEAGGLAGSRVFVANERKSGIVYEGTAILDMVGYKTGERNRAFAIVDDYPGPFPSTLCSAVAEFGLNLDFELVEGPWIRYSDHYSFWLGGYPSTLVIEELSNTTSYPANPYYHTAGDTSDRISGEQIAELTKALLAGLLELVEPGEEDATHLAIATGAACAGTAAVAIGAFLCMRTKRSGRL